MRLDEISNQNKFIADMSGVRYQFKNSFDALEAEFELFYFSKNITALHNFIDLSAEPLVNEMNIFLNRTNELFYKDSETIAYIAEIKDLKNKLEIMIRKIKKIK